jgi:hypothetical protein
MVRMLFALVAGVAVLSFAGATADDKKDEKKTLEGKLVCTKCELKETKSCGHALLVKEKGKKDETKYYIKDKGGKEKYHAACCQEPADAKVTGKVTEEEKDGKKRKVIEEAKVEIKAKK